MATGQVSRQRLWVARLEFNADPVDGSLKRPLGKLSASQTALQMSEHLVIISICLYIAIFWGDRTSAWGFATLAVRIPVISLKYGDVYAKECPQKGPTQLIRGMPQALMRYGTAASLLTNNEPL